MTDNIKSKYNFSDDVKQYFKEKNFRFKKYPSENIGSYSSIDDLTEFIEKEILFWEEIET